MRTTERKLGDDIALWICPECGADAPPLAGVFTEHVRADRKDWCNGVARPLTMRDVRIAALIEAARLQCDRCERGDDVHYDPTEEIVSHKNYGWGCGSGDILVALFKEWL